MLKDFKDSVIFVKTQQQRYEAMRACDVAMAASGTVNLELSMAQVPFVIAYKVNALTAWLGSKFIKVKYMTMTNIILDKPAVPEFLQSACTANNLFMAVRKFLSDKDACRSLIEDEAKITSQLAPEGTTPSERAAQVIAEHLYK